MLLHYWEFSMAITAISCSFSDATRSSRSLLQVGLMNSGDDRELSLWALACLVNGWGRIHIIERLAETRDEQIKAWMLRDGFQNEIMLRVYGPDLRQYRELSNSSSAR